MLYDLSLRVDAIMTTARSILQSEVTPASPSPSASYATNRAVWLREVSQFATRIRAHLRGVEGKRKEAERKNETIEQDLVIVRALKMRQNCADLEKEKGVNDVLIGKWKEEERELREACAALVPMMKVVVCEEKGVMEGIMCEEKGVMKGIMCEEKGVTEGVVYGEKNATEGVVYGEKNATKRTVLEEETKDVMECIAGIYAVLGVVGVEYALPEEQKNRLGKMIARAREAKRKETSE